MLPLIDADILLHELGWSGEFKDKGTGKYTLMDFDFVADLLDKKIVDICTEAEGTEPPILFITNSEWIQSISKRLVHDVPPYEPIFRYALAKTRPYKGNRKNPKPFHFNNIIVHLDANYDLRISSEGYEADDMMCMMQYANQDKTIICSRDKDLRICPGWHYSWECGGQRSVGPILTDELGWLELRKGKVLGYGKKFFYYQMLVGDSADHIPGLQGWGQVKAYKTLEGLETVEDCHKTVEQAYIDIVGEEGAEEYFMEQANLLWMIHERGVYFGSK